MIVWSRPLAQTSIGSLVQSIHTLTDEREESPVHSTPFWLGFEGWIVLQTRLLAQFPDG
jgi:hypothetical protein